jgi:2-dehydropantoate 2-reductase
MRPREPTIAVVGAGAIGGVTAAFLDLAGKDLEIVCKHQEIVDRATSDGFHIFGAKGEHRIRLKAVRDIHHLSGPKDMVLLATKANDCVAAAQDLLPFLHPHSALVSLQNGICEDALAQVVGRDRVVGCVVGWGATFHGPGELEITSEGEFVVGNLDQQPDGRLPRLQDLLGTVTPTRISGNILGELYAKLIINSCINSLGVITGLRLGKLLARRKVRNLFVEIMREAMAVAEAMNIRVEPGGGGKLDYYRFLAGRGLPSRWRQHIMVRIIGFKYRRITSSSLQSLMRGRRTEIDYLNGYIAERAHENDVPTPLNDAIVGMVKEIEEGKRAVDPDNLNDPHFRGY